MRNSKILLIGALVFNVGISAAKAEVFQWRDPKVKVSLTFPDDWRRIASQGVGDVVTIAAPGANDHAECRLRVSDDRRFVVYPREFAGAIQRTAYSRKFWEDYAGQYGTSIIYTVGDNAGLGDGFASWADVSFTTASGPKVQKRGIMYATVYNDHAYVLECSAETEAFAKWYHPFLSILKSVDMRDEYAMKINGKYRPFQNDRDLLIHGEKDVDLFVY